MSRSYRRKVPFWSAEVLGGILLVVAVVAVRALVTMFSVNWVLAAWTEVRLDPWAGLGLAILISDLKGTANKRENA